MSETRDDLNYERLRAALSLIRLNDWGWRGGGSPERIPGEHSRLASQVLGLPVELPLGWPSQAEHDERRRLSRICASSADTPLPTG